MTNEQAIQELRLHIEHWERLTEEHIAPKEEAERTVDALLMAIEALSEPSGDLISREDAIELCAKAQGRASTKSELKGISKIWQGLLKLPSAEAEWIPCSERLPERGVGLHYLVTLKDGHIFRDDVYEAFFDKNGWHMDCNELAYDDVIAWMPLPKPYREDGEA